MKAQEAIEKMIEKEAAARDRASEMIGSDTIEDDKERVRWIGEYRERQAAIIALHGALDAVRAEAKA